MFFKLKKLPLKWCNLQVCELVPFSVIGEKRRSGILLVLPKIQHITLLSCKCVSMHACVCIAPISRTRTWVHTNIVRTCLLCEVLHSSPRNVSLKFRLFYHFALVLQKLPSPQFDVFSIHVSTYYAQFSLITWPWLINEGPHVVSPYIVRTFPVCAKYANEGPHVDVLTSAGIQEKSSKCFLW